MVFEKIRSLLSEQLGFYEEMITESTSFEDLGADSLDLVELMMSLEEEFSISADEEELTDVKTVGDVVKLIEANL
mgnify:CR=1 FL=1